MLPVEEWDDDTPAMQLYWAVTEADLDRVKAFLDEGMSADTLSYMGDSLLEKAAELGQVQVARLLIERGADVNFQEDTGDTALMSAVEEGHLEMVDLLLDAGADMAALGGWGAGSALHTAARNQNVEMVKLLLDWGADPNIEDMDGDTASYLQHFFSTQNPPDKTAQILELLKKAGATSSRRQERLLNSVDPHN